MDIDEALARVEALLVRDGCVLLGITGCPGAGKTTFAEQLVGIAEANGVPAAHVPMDGFHLADTTLGRLGRLDRKGAIDTFDAWGYRALLQRLRDREDEPIYAPGFERTLEQPIAGSIAVEPGTELIVTEGNYLLSATRPWADVRALCTEVWFCEAPADLRRERLITRHISFGKSPREAAAWVDGVDMVNAASIEETRPRADAVVTP